MSDGNDKTFLDDFTRGMVSNRPPRLGDSLGRQMGHDFGHSDAQSGGSSHASSHSIDAPIFGAPICDLSDSGLFGVWAFVGALIGLVVGYLFDLHGLLGYALIAGAFALASCLVLALFMALAAALAVLFRVLSWLIKFGAVVGLLWIGYQVIGH